MGPVVRPRPRRLLIVTVTAATLVVGLGVAGGPVGTLTAGWTTQAARADSVDDRKKSVDQQIDDLKDDLEGAKDDFVEAAVVLRRTQLQLADARAALDAAQKQLQAARVKDDQLAAQLLVAQAEADKAQREIDAQNRAEAQTRTELGQIARQAYVDGGLSGVGVALQASDPDEFTQRMALAGAALRAQDGTIDRLAVQQADMRARTARLEAYQAQITELKRQSALVVAELQAAQDAAAAAAAQVATLAAAQQKALDDIQGKIESEKSRLDDLQAEQTKLQALLAARAKAAREKAAREAARRRAQQQGGGSGDSGSDSGGDSGGFLSRAADGPITSGFGPRYHPILHIWRMHTGIDFGVACGTPVRATADGEVIQAGWAGGYGNRIVIDHGEVRGVDLATTYNHLSSIVARSGSVRRGELIGYSGTTGLSTGCHLHFETLADGSYVNPMNWL